MRVPTSHQGEITGVDNWLMTLASHLFLSVFNTSIRDDQFILANKLVILRGNTVIRYRDPFL